MKSKWSRWAVAAWCGWVFATGAPVAAQPDDTLVLTAADAFRKRDRGHLAALRARVAEQQHPLASWVDYWELHARLFEATPAEVEAFYDRWRGTYVEDRLRNDWLLELGRRGDWANVRADFPRFRMNDDRQVTCYALLADHHAGKPVRDAARAQWFAQRDADEACHRLAETLFTAGQLGSGDVWHKLRLAIEYGRPRAAKQAATLLPADVSTAVSELADQPARYLSRKASARSRTHAELAALALARMAASDAEAAAGQLDARWQQQLPPDLAGWAWTITARQTAQKLLPNAHRLFERAHALAHKGGPGWTDDTLAWRVRAALRAVDAPDRWQTVRRAIDAMSAGEQKDPAWVYWKARALLELAPRQPESEADEMRLQGRAALLSIAGPLTFYGQLAAEELELPLALPTPPRTARAPDALPKPVAALAGDTEVDAEPDDERAREAAAAPVAAASSPPVSAAAASAPAPGAERERVRQHPGLARALQLIALGLRSEGVREWNFSLRGMNDRELIAAAQLACDREVWDRCINTSDRTRHEIHVGQRYPMPFRTALEGQARDAGLDPAYVFGLVRQESRFLTDARSHVGASGLMQVMPSTARWVAGKIGLPYRPELISDRDVNLRLGTAYLRLVLDDFGGSQALAAAAYNAGPSRPRRWREGPQLETAVWAESIPFPETRDYVKKVLANAVVYASLLDPAAPASLKSRLGPGVGPRDPDAPAPDRNLP